MSITLYDIFYQHREWWNDPSLGHDTQGKYGKVLAEMEICAIDYAKDIKDIGDKWEKVIVDETRELCRPNHYSFFLTGEKKEWHDSVVEDFLLFIRKALEHYGYNFKELPEIIQKQYGIEYLRKAPKPQPEAPQQANDGSIEEMAGYKKRTKPEPQQLPQELSTQEAKAYFKKAIELGLMDNTYKWLKGLQMMACFAVEMSNKLNLDKGTLADGRKRISWKPFEILFNIEQGKLRLNYNDVQKTGKTPNEMNLIYKVFE